VTKTHENWTLACKGDTLPVLIIWFHRILASFSSSFNEFCFFQIVVSPNMMALIQCQKLIKFFLH
jgi:hypothetical protein